MKKEESKQFIRWCIAAAVCEKKHTAPSQDDSNFDLILF